LATLKVKYAELQEQHAALETEIATLKEPGATEPKTDSVEAVKGDTSSALEADSKAELTKLKGDLETAMAGLDEKAKVVTELQETVKHLEPDRDNTEVVHRLLPSRPNTSNFK
jgi:chromosome segregation ATPase